MPRSLVQGREFNVKCSRLPCGAKKQRWRGALSASSWPGKTP